MRGEPSCRLCVKVVGELVRKGQLEAWFEKDVDENQRALKRMKLQFPADVRGANSERMAFSFKGGCYRMMKWVTFFPACICCHLVNQ